MNTLSFNNIVYDRITGRISEPVDEVDELTTEVARLETEIAEKTSSLEDLHTSLSTTDSHQLLGNLTQSFHLESVIQHLKTRLNETKSYTVLSQKALPFIQGFRKSTATKQEINLKNKTKLTELKQILKDRKFTTSFSFKNLELQISEVEQDLFQKEWQFYGLLQSATLNPADLDLKHELLELEVGIYNIKKRLEILKRFNYLIKTESLPIKFRRNFTLEKMSISPLDKKIIKIKYQVLPDLKKELDSLELSQPNEVTLQKTEITKIKIHHALGDLEILERFNLKRKVLSQFSVELQNIHLEQDLIGKAIEDNLTQLGKFFKEINEI